MKKIGTALTIITCVVLSGCGNSKGITSSLSEENGYAYDAGGSAYATEDIAIYEEYDSASYTTDTAVADAAEAPAAQESQTELLLENQNAKQQRKLIKTVDLSVETEDYDSLLGTLEKQIAALGGYIEYQYQYNGSIYSDYQTTRDSQMKIRIPVECLDEFVVKVGEWTNITNKEERVEDVTLRYVDLESHKKALLTEQERLLELLEQAESVEDIIAIEQRLSDVRYELESMESQLRTLDNQIDYSTINLNIQEVRRLTPTEEKSAWDKMKNGFVRTIYQIGDDVEYGFIWFVINIPYFIIWIIIILIVFFVIRAFLRRRKRKAETKLRNEREAWEKERTDASSDKKTENDQGKQE